MSPRPISVLALPALLLPALSLLLAGCAGARQGATQPGQAPSPPEPVVLDGRFGEWAGVPAAAASAGGLVREVKVRHDAGNVYLLLDLAEEASLQTLPRTLSLLLDADGDRATGWSEAGMAGVDAAILFSPPDPRNPARPGTGVALRTSAPGAGEARVAPAYEAGVVFAPSHAARRFEVRLSRGGAVAFGTRFAAALAAGGGETLRFAHALAPAAPRPAGPGAGAADPLARAPGTDFRVLGWNVGRKSPWDQPEAFGRILRALKPDVLLLDEVSGEKTAAEVAALLERIAPGERPWNVVYGESGGGQRGVIASRARVTASPAFAGILPYPDSVLALLPPDAPEEARRDALRQKAEGVAAMGAVVEAGGRRLLAVTVDLQCCGAPGDPADRLRRIEALAIRDALRRAVAAGGIDGVVVAGDLNLVGTRDPLEILAAGPETDGSALAVAEPRRLDGLSLATWENPSDRFTPGRLDFLLFGDRALGVAGAFVFSSGDLSPAHRARHGVREETSGQATDHRPVVVDLRWVSVAR